MKFFFSFFGERWDIFTMEMLCTVEFPSRASFSYPKKNFFFLTNEAQQRRRLVSLMKTQNQQRRGGGWGRRKKSARISHMSKLMGKFEFRNVEQNFSRVTDARKKNISWGIWAFFYVFFRRRLVEPREKILGMKRPTDTESKPSRYWRKNFLEFF